MAGFSVANLSDRLRDPAFAAAMVHYASWLAEMTSSRGYGRYEVTIQEGKVVTMYRGYTDRMEAA